MAYSNQTTHYGLPQPTSGDKSTFLDTNEAFGRVDSALYGAATDATAAKQQADDLTLQVNDLKVSVLDLKSSVLDAKTDINLLMANMGQAMTDIDNLQIDTTKLKLDVTDIMVSRLPVKIDTFSGQVEDAEQTSYTAVTADGIAYDETNQQLLLKVDGADTVIPFSRGGGGGGTNFDNLSVKEYYSYEEPTPVMSSHINYNYSSRLLTLKAGFKKGNYLLLNVKSVYWTPGTAPAGITVTPIGTIPSGLLYSVNISDDIATDTTWQGTASGANVGFYFLNTVVEP